MMSLFGKKRTITIVHVLHFVDFILAQRKTNLKNKKKIIKYCQKITLSTYTVTVQTLNILIQDIIPCFVAFEIKSIACFAYFSLNLDKSTGCSTILVLSSNGNTSPLSPESQGVYPISTE